jgi:DNA polymerase (family 10)
MKNQLVARILYEIAELLALDGVAFKPQAYRRAAQVIETLGEPIESLVAAGTHRDLPGVGDAIAKKIAEIVETGRLEYHEKLKAKLPIDLFALTQVDGVGPKTAKLLYEELGVRDLADLERAAREGKIRDVKGLGAKTEEKILRGLGETRQVEGRILLGRASDLADDLIERLMKTGLFARIEAAGSLRRGRETIGDLDLLAVAVRPEEAPQAADAFVGLADVEEVLARGAKKSSVRLAGGVQVDLRIVPSESFGAALQYFTGSKAHNIALRKRAVAKGWKLSEYGLFGVNDRVLAGPEEAEIYARLGLQFVPPELREDEGEIQRAEAGSLPGLIESEDVRGDLHVHTDRSDGKASLEEMVDAARARGLSYVAITDHAKFAEVIGGLTPDDLRRQIDEIAALDEGIKGFRVLTGIEVNVQQDGSLDVPDELLARLDVVTAAVHSYFRLDRDGMTARLIRAVEHEHVDVLAHPTGRKIGERPAYEADWDAVFKAAADHKTAMEINANPIRLDLNAELVRRAIAAGVKLAIGSDAHTPEHFDFLRLGVLTARRGWATKADVLNALPAGKLRSSRRKVEERGKG